MNSKRPLMLDKKRILELSDKGFHYYKIAKKIGRTNAGLYNFMVRHNIELNCKKQPFSIKAHHAEIIELVEQGLFIDEIAEKIGGNYSSIGGYMINHGIDYKKRQGNNGRS